MNELKKNHRHGMLKVQPTAQILKIEELVSFVRAASSSEEDQNSLASMHEALDKVAGESGEKDTC